MDITIKTIEDLSLNAWPSHQIQVYDGWLLRFSYFYTHRTNSVEQIGASLLPLSEKIPYCEEVYRKWGTPAIFKITPLLDPSFDRMLAERGYITKHETEVMTMQLADYRGSSLSSVPVSIRNTIPQSWIEGLFALKGTTNIMHRQVVPSMYRAIPKDTICADIRDNGRIIATGLGILDREYIGLYAIHVHPDYRRKHFARAICCSILEEARRQGASRGYLQVVKGNTPARALYESLGFQFLYEYWFRTRYFY